MYDRSSSTNESSPACNICTGRDQVWKHKHWSQYDGDLAKHLQENGFSEDRIPPILQWVHSLRARYGGMVDERGVPLSAWEARRAQHLQYEKTYTGTPEPRTANGRKITFRAFTSLLTSARSDHATAWADMTTAQFSEADMADEGKWSDFVKFMREYEHSSADPNNAPFLERVDVRPVVKMAGGER